MSKRPEPLVSIVTPFYNTVEFLAECIESVLGQTYQNWEYILVNNCSTDGSAEIARKYAERDRRIRIVDNPELLLQVPNYNRALSLISDASEYVKMVEADNWIYPECVAQMVLLGEANPRIGIVGSYCITERTVRFLGLPRTSTVIAGREAARMHFMDDAYYFGAPTTVLMRAEAVRRRLPFYDESTWLVEDLSACYELLRDWDFGFVHQVLTFVRTENDGSIQSGRRGYDAMALDRLAVLTRHGSDFLDKEEHRTVLRRTRNHYYSRLAFALLQGKPQGLWEYHRAGLAEIGLALDYPRMALRLVTEVIRLAVNPGSSAMALLRSLKTPRPAPVNSAAMLPLAEEGQPRKTDNMIGAEGAD